MAQERFDPVAATRDGERGSAYLATLLLLVLLTIVGLSLAVITQTEIFIGGSERVTTRTYFSDASAVHMMLAGKFVAGETSAQKWELEQRTPMHGTSVIATDTVQTSSYFPIAQRPCNLCTINEDRALNYVAGQYAVTVRSQPVIGGEIGATKLVGVTQTGDPVLMDITGAQYGGDQHIDVHDPDRVRIQF